MLKLLTFFVLIAVSLFSFADTLELSETKLLEMAIKESPQLNMIEANYLDLKVKDLELNEQFAPEFFGRGSYAETNEKAIMAFMPIWTPIKQAQLGIRKNLKHGFTTEVAVTTDQRSTSAPFGTFKNATTTALSFSMQMDLWKDLFGRLSKLRLDNAGLETRKANLEKEINVRTFNINLRRIFWAIVANQESLKISQELLETAKKQAKETNQRYKNAVAESDEVALYEAQVASRQGTLVYLQYQRELLFKQLKSIFPELVAADLKVGSYDLATTFDQVMSCTAIIAQESKVPYQNTKYDEISEIIRKYRVNVHDINARYHHPEVKLYGTVKATGVDSEELSNAFNRGSYGGAVDDIQATNRTGYEAGLKFSIPIGDSKSSTQEAKELYGDKKLGAMLASNDLQVANTHEQLVRQVSLLNEVIKANKINSEQLAKRLKVMQKKYQQARVSVSELINDQDALLSSELTSIDTKLQILNVLFDYLAIFTETPCPFNRI